MANNYSSSAQCRSSMEAIDDLNKDTGDNTVKADMAARALGFFPQVCLLSVCVCARVCVCVAGACGCLGVCVCVCVRACVHR